MAADPGEAARAFTEAAAEPLRRKGYEILSLIAEGANTRVYRVRRARDGKDFALRIYKLPGERKKFHAAKRSALLFRLFRWRMGKGHPNVVRLTDSGSAAVEVAGSKHRLPYSVMELAEGPTLREVIEDGSLREMGLAGALRVLQGVIAGVEYMRGRGLRHGDLEPQNVVLTGRAKGGMVPKLIDLAPRMASSNPRRNDHIKLQMTLASVLLGRWVAKKDVKRVDDAEAARYWRVPAQDRGALEDLCRLVERLGPSGAMFRRSTAEFRTRFEETAARLGF